MNRSSAVVLAAALVCASSAHAQVRFDPAKRYQVDEGDAPALGAASPLVTIVEFSDFYCGFCRRANETIRTLLQLYPDELRVVYVHSPLDPVDGTLAAEAALAAEAQGKFWMMHDRIFAGPRGAGKLLLERYAAEIGLDLGRYRADMHDRAHLDRLGKHVGRAQQLGIRSSPMFFVNGRPISGAQGIGVFTEVVEDELERARKMIQAGVDRGELYSTLIARGARRGTTGAISEPPRNEIEPGRRYPVDLGLPGHQEGPDEALVTIVEFSDFQCQFCRRSAPVLDEVLRIYGGKVRLVHRHLPLGFHPNAQLAAEAAVEAAAQGKFREYATVLLDNQRALDRGSLERYAERVELDIDAFRSALDSRKHLTAVARDAAAAARLGIRGTPTFFVNGAALIGARPLSDFRLAVDAELEYAEKLVESGVPRGGVYSYLKSIAAAAQVEPDDTSAISQRDYHLAVLMACQDADRERAAALLEKIEDPLRRRSIVDDCRGIGIDLSSSK